MFETTSIYLVLLIVAVAIFYITKKSKSNQNSDCQKIPQSDNPLHINNKTTNSPSVSTLMDTDIENKESDIKPMLLKEPREGGKDNLQLIKGVGKVLEKVLNDMGIYHFDQIANWTDEEANWIDKSIAFPGRIQREKWVEQAKILASGETTEFAQRVKKGKVATSKKS
ncbi:MAG: hypothetical protein GXO60_03660 [Epsilonproteobacteria bacterium]|nr:hypothetical protein [Campylobacterota bacterium]